MALETVAAFAAALNQEFGDQVFLQANRKAVLLSLLAQNGAVEAELGGKTCAWDVTFSGAAAGPFAEGADVDASDLAQDIDVPASLPWGLYRSNFGFSGLADAVAASSGSSPAILRNRKLKDMLGSASKLGSTLNAALYSGSGSDAVIGLQTALAATGSFAGINRATYAEWVPTVLSNSGTARALTKDLLDELDSEIYVKCGESPNIYVCSPGVARKYESLFETTKRTIVVTGELSPAASVSAPQPNRERGETGLHYHGQMVHRDKDAPTGHFYALNSDYIRLRFVPVVLDDGGSAEPLTDGDLVSTGRMIHFQKLAKTGDSKKQSLVCYPQTAFPKMNAHGVINDIDET